MLYIHKPTDKVTVICSGSGECNRRPQSNKLHCKSIELPRALKESLWSKGVMIYWWYEADYENHRSQSKSVSKQQENHIYQQISHIMSQMRLRLRYLPLWNLPCSQFRQQPSCLFRDCLMIPRFITHFAAILFITKLEEIWENSVLFLFLRITNFSSGHHRNERRGRQNETALTKYTIHANASRMEIVRQQLPSQFGGTNHALNVQVSTARQLNNYLFEIAYPYKTSTIDLCYQRKKKKKRNKK